MRRALIAIAVTATALLTLAPPAGAATSTIPGPVTTTRSHFAAAFWATDPVKTSTGFRLKTWFVQFNVSSAPGLNDVEVGTCVDQLDDNQLLTRQTCTTGDKSGFASTFDLAGLTHASVRAGGIPAETCSYDGNGDPLGPCKPASPMSVNATWTGTGPITYSTYTTFIPGTYWYQEKDRNRDADNSATFNGKQLQAPSAGAYMTASVVKEKGSPCGAITPRDRSATGTGAVPNGC